MGEGDGSDKEARWLIDSLILSAARKETCAAGKSNWKCFIEKTLPGHKPDAAICASNVSCSPHYPQDVALPATL